MTIMDNLKYMLRMLQIEVALHRIVYDAKCSNNAKRLEEYTPRLLKHHSKTIDLLKKIAKHPFTNHSDE